MAVETIMAEEETKPQVKEPEETKETKEPEVTEDKVEILAREMGWRPEDDFQGDKVDFVDAEAYIRKGQDIQNSMRKSLKDQKQQLSDMSTNIADLKVHNEKVYRVEIANLKKEITSLGIQKKEAIEDGDVQKVNEIDEQIDTIKESMSQDEEPGQTQQQPATNQEFDEWVKDNPWYLVDKEMGSYADSIAENSKGVSFKRIAALVDKKVKEMFPDKFMGQQKKNGTTVNTDRVESATRKQSTSKFTEANLTKEQKGIMTQFVKRGIMTKADYISDVALMAGGTR